MHKNLLAIMLFACICGKIDAAKFDKGAVGSTHYFSDEEPRERRIAALGLMAPEHAQGSFVSSPADDSFVKLLLKQAKQNKKAKMAAEQALREAQQREQKHRSQVAQVAKELKHWLIVKSASPHERPSDSPNLSGLLTNLTDLADLSEVACSDDEESSRSTSPMAQAVVSCAKEEKRACQESVGAKLYYDWACGSSSLSNNVSPAGFLPRSSYENPSHALLPIANHWDGV